MRIALAPTNPIIGDLAGNADLVAAALDDARSRHAELIAFPELSVCGYPPRDLLLHRWFVEACERTTREIGTTRTAGLTAVIGTPIASGGDRGVANAAMVFRDNELIATYRKRLLPTYDVFDEDRYFDPGDGPVTFDLDGVTVGVALCEDLWRGRDAAVAERYGHAADPIGDLARAGAGLIVELSANPFVQGKARKRYDLLRDQATRHGVAIASINQCGANDDLIFDGHAMLMGRDGRVIAAGRAFSGTTLIAETAAPADDRGDPIAEARDEELTTRALITGVRDYVEKTRSPGVIVGLSGGIDSAVTAAMAAAALGPERLLGVGMPGPYSSDGSITDARELAERLGCRWILAPIADAHAGLTSSVDHALRDLGEPRLGERLPDIAAENLQSRTRGALLMALSNRTGSLVLTTGNKSELAVGYCTLYGDMNGGLAVLSDLPKTWVYRIATWINDHHDAIGLPKPPIPASTIEKPPSAELGPDQLDSDSLPPYDVLDLIVEDYVESRHSVAQIVERRCFDAELVERMARLIDRNEYKRHQLAIGLKVRTVAFGRGRRMPVVGRRSAPSSSPPACPTARETLSKS